MKQSLCQSGFNLEQPVYCSSVYWREHLFRWFRAGKPRKPLWTCRKHLFRRFRAGNRGSPQVGRTDRRMNDTGYGFCGLSQVAAWMWASGTTPKWNKPKNPKYDLNWKTRLKPIAKLFNQGLDSLWNLQV